MMYAADNERCLLHFRINPTKNGSKNTIITECGNNSLRKKNLYQTDSGEGKYFPSPRNFSKNSSYSSTSSSPNRTPERPSPTRLFKSSPLQFHMEGISSPNKSDTPSRSKPRSSTKQRSNSRGRSESRGSSQSRRKSRSPVKHRDATSKERREERQAERLAREREYSNTRMYDEEHYPNDPVDTDQNRFGDDLQFRLDDL